MRLMVNKVSKLPNREGNKKAQITLEFILLFSIVFFLFIGLEKVISVRIGLRRDAKINNALEDIGGVVKDEISNAQKAVGDYSRTFDIPDNLFGMNYSVNIENQFLVVEYDKYQFITLVENISGQPKPGSNIIRKINKKICINTECT